MNGKQSMSEECLRPGESVVASGEALMTARELAQFLRVHENYVYDLAVRAVLPSYKIGGLRRFRLSDVLAWVESQRGTNGGMANRE